MRCVTRPTPPSLSARPDCRRAGRDFTALGSNGALGALVLAGSGLLALARRRVAALFLLASFWGALASEAAVKHWYGRPRPQLVPPAARVFTTSFPSGHATVSGAVGLAAALLLARTRPERRFGIAAAAAAICLVGLIGASRIYLGLHWPTDVLAGWALGTAWGAQCWTALGRTWPGLRGSAEAYQTMESQEMAAQMAEEIPSAPALTSAGESPRTSMSGARSPTWWSTSARTQTAPKRPEHVQEGRRDSQPASPLFASRPCPGVPAKGGSHASGGRKSRRWPW